jgi:hypothetical protein
MKHCEQRLTFLNSEAFIITDKTFSADRGLPEPNQKKYDYDIIKELTGNGLEQPIKR